MQIYHIFEMSHAQHGLGIIAHSSPTMKKLDKKKSLFQGTIEEVSAKRQEFIKKPQLVADINLCREQQEQKDINKLIKKIRK